MCRGIPTETVYRGTYRFTISLDTSANFNPRRSTLRMPAESHDQLNAHPVPITRSTTQSFKPTNGLFSVIMCERSHQSDVWNLHVWCQSFILKIWYVHISKWNRWKTVAALEDTLLSCRGLNILLKCIWFSSHTNRNAKTKTSYWKKKKGTTWSSWTQDTLFSLSDVPHFSYWTLVD